MSELFPTTPNLPTQGDTVSTAKEFAGAMTLDLSDAEIDRAMTITKTTLDKHRAIWIRKYPFNTIEQVADLIEEFEKELGGRMMDELDVLVKVDGTPLFMGQPMIIDWIGKMPGTSLAQYGQDHERKTWEVQRADELGEDWHGQKGKKLKRKNQ